jgi:hypothetical protein
MTFTPPPVNATRNLAGRFAVVIGATDRAAEQATATFTEALRAMAPDTPTPDTPT